VKFIKDCAFSVSLFALAVGTTAFQANAQGLKGTFNLPFEAHWNTAVLQPGQYTLRLSMQSTMYPVIFVSGQGKTVMVLVGTSGSTSPSDHSYLRIENVGQTHIVREFTSGVTGRRLTFIGPKSVKDQVALARNAQDTTIPVAQSGGN